MSGVAVRGVGVLLPGATGRGPFCEALRSGQGASTGDFRISGFDLGSILPDAGRFRRAAPATCFALAASAMAANDAGLSLPELAGGRTGVVAAITHGAIGYAVRYHEGLVRDGVQCASPLHFTESVLNAPAGNVSIAFGILGPVHTLEGEETAGIRAIALAASLLRSGHVDRCIVVGTEEREPVVDRARGSFDRLGGSDASCPPGEGSVAFLLVRDDSDEAEGCPILATAFGSTGWGDGGEAGAVVGRAVGEALSVAGLSDGDVGHVVLPAGRGRRLVARWIDGRFGDPPRRIDPGALFGNARGASGLVQVAVSSCPEGVACGSGLTVTTGYDGTVAVTAVRAGGRG